MPKKPICGRVKKFLRTRPQFNLSLDRTSLQALAVECIIVEIASVGDAGITEASLEWPIIMLLNEP